MSSQEHIALLAENNLTNSEIKKRAGLAIRKPYIAKKLANIKDMEERGEISPIIRIEKSYLCNFQCTHCSAEYYMDRHLEKVLKVKEDRNFSSRFVRFVAMFRATVVFHAKLWES